MARRPLMSSYKKDVPAWTRNRVESIQERLDNLEKIAENLNSWVAELRRSNKMMTEALREMARGEESDYAVALAQLTADRRRG